MRIMISQSGTAPTERPLVGGRDDTLALLVPEASLLLHVLFMY